MRIRLLIVLFCLCSVMPLAALEITAVSPSTAAPGASVTLSGGPFAAGDTVLIGDRRLAATAISPTRLTFTVPALASGLYAASAPDYSPQSRHPRQLYLRQ